jgi:hypothetical protein
MTNQQSTSNILMIRPVNFGFNEETAESNAFQKRNPNQQAVQDKALAEFDHFVKTLKHNGVNVTVENDTPQPYTPDSIFPNNWVSFHHDGTVFLYPMQAENRRLERREDIITDLEDKFKVAHVIDLSRFEAEHMLACRHVQIKKFWIYFANKPVISLSVLKQPINMARPSITPMF